jgi:Dienelactone hydrolase and related enzymes
LFILLSLLLLLSSQVSAAEQTDTEFVKIPVHSNGSAFIDDARIIKPQGDGPFPLLVLTHGTPRNAEERAKTDVATYFKKQSDYFAGKGYVVLFVVRRGFGASTAPYEENPSFANGTKNYTKAGLEAAKDLKAAIDYMRDKQYVDAKRILLVGQSTGGHSVIATGSLRIDGVIGIVNFAGGRGSYAPDLVRDEKNLIDSFAGYGKTSRIPTLWLYSANDHYFRPDLAQAFYKAYTDNGGQAKFIVLPPYADDGHKSFAGNRSVWAPYVDQFLDDITGK